MNPAALEQLRDLHLPEPVGFWPPAPGWWLLAALLAAGVAILLWLLRRRRQANLYRRRALQALAEIRRRWQQEGDAARTLAEANALLRRTALACWPRAEVASLPPALWRQWLQQQSGLQGFAGESGRVLTEGGYRALPDGDVDAALRLAEAWIRRHRRPPC